MTRAVGFIVVIVAAGLAAAVAGDKDGILPKTEVPKSNVVKDADPENPSRAGQARQDNGLKMAFVWAPPGHFHMGTPIEKRQRVIVQEDEGPVDVELTNGFWIAQSEVTQKQWMAVMGTKPWKGRFHVREGDDYPATFVSSVRAVEFCDKMTALERESGRLKKGSEYSLPTEAEWEYACRAGTTTSYSFGDSEDELDNYAWNFFNTRGARFPRKVMTLKPNSWGLFDMQGNVCEWCLDHYQRELQGGINPVRVPTTPIYGRVIRGGSCITGRMTSAARNCDYLLEATVRIGFRPVIVKRREIWLPDDRETPDEIEDIERNY